MFPPNAGRICTRSLFSFICNTVQSAVSPVRKRAAALGAKDLPLSVAPIIITEGFTLFTKSSNALVYGPIRKSFNSGES